VSARPPVYEGRLVRLRAFEPEDLPLVHRWMNDTEVQEHQGIWYPRSRAQVGRIIERDGEPGYSNLSLAIVTRDDGRLIGDAGLHGASPEDRCATVGITIGEKSLWDGGYGTDAMRVICRVGFKVMNVRRIELHVFGGNARARHVYRKLGFVEEAVCHDVLFKHGRYIDDVIMSLLPGELVE
jgi:RimJ/RimL family protein N-acetyltransferase